MALCEAKCSFFYKPNTKSDIRLILKSVCSSSFALLMFPGWWCSVESTFRPGCWNKPAEFGILPRHFRLLMPHFWSLWAPFLAGEINSRALQSRKSIPCRCSTPGGSQTGSQTDAGMEIMNTTPTAGRTGHKDGVKANEGGLGPPVGVREVQRRYWRTVIDLKKRTNTLFTS